MQLSQSAEGTSEQIGIRAVTSNDAASARKIAVVSMLAWDRDPAPIELDKLARKLEKQISALEPDKKAMFVAEKSGAVVGFGRMVRDSGEASQWWLAGLFVHPDHRGRGIGRSLVRACVSYAKKRAATVIRSETHLDNTTSIRFHERVGFKTVGMFVAPDGDHKMEFTLPLR